MGTYASLLKASQQVWKKASLEAPVGVGFMLIFLIAVLFADHFLFFTDQTTQNRATQQTWLCIIDTAPHFKYW